MPARSVWHKHVGAMGFLLSQFSKLASFFALSRSFDLDASPRSTRTYSLLRRIRRRAGRLGGLLRAAGGRLAWTRRPWALARTCRCAVAAAGRLVLAAGIGVLEWAAVALAVLGHLRRLVGLIHVSGHQDGSRCQTSDDQHGEDCTSGQVHWLSPYLQDSAGLDSDNRGHFQVTDLTYWRR
jgi:hypothetical protein